MRPAQLTPENLAFLGGKRFAQRHFNEAGAINAGKHEARRGIPTASELLQ